MGKRERGNKRKIESIGVHVKSGKHSDKPYRLWENDEKYVFGFRCLYTPKCKLCDSDLILWSASPQKFSINDGNDEKNSHSLDVVLWCPECGFTNLFGLAFSEEHYELVGNRIKELRSS